MLNGNMCCGVNKDDLMVRVMPEECDAALKRPHARVFDLTGKPMKGFVLVTPKGYSSDKALKEWIEMGVKCARSLLAKAAKKKPRKK